MIHLIFFRLFYFYLKQGRMSYSVKGCVLLPSKNPPTTFSAVTGQSNSGVVKFYNPLDEIVYVNLKLKGNINNLSQ